MVDDILVWTKLKKTDIKYDYLEVVGQTEYRTPLAHRRKTRYRFEDPLFAALPHHLKEPLKLISGPYYMADGDVESYKLSVKKMDVAPVRQYEGTIAYEFAMKLVFRKNYENFKDRKSVV